MIVADTGAVLALIDADDGHHETLTAAFREDPSSWVVPWAVLPEVDYLLGAHLGSRAQDAFLSDLGRGEWVVDWGGEADLRRANEIATRYRTLRLGLVDAAVIAAAERLRASAIATLDLRHFGAVAIRGRPRLIPRDL
ncbi:MAG TPA: PIN domain-containing protein [Methylomirabilota bacterium]|nr:PIN domain-containing protein [Methylomirabilota bacterium]